jgi:hypothetical protein
VIALDPLGQPLAKNGLRAELVREDYQYYWYHDEGRWNYKLIIRDSTPAGGQTLNLTAGQPTVVTQRGLGLGPLPPGRARSDHRRRLQRALHRRLVRNPQRGRHSRPNEGDAG